MKIDNELMSINMGIMGANTRQDQPDARFASMLDSERLKIENDAARNLILAKQDTRLKDLKKVDIEFIRENGMRAYAEKMHQKKIDEMREKLLKLMGLTEEKLSEMSPDTRMAIEKMITQEIQDALAADSLTNGDSTPYGQADGPGGAGRIDSENLLAAQVIGSGSGSVVGLTIADGMAQPASADTPLIDEEQ